MSLKDHGRATDTALRDLLRRLERDANAYSPARPSAPPPAMLAAAPAPQVVQVGDWTLSQDPDSGDLVATHNDGTTRTVASRGVI